MLSAQAKCTGPSWRQAGRGSRLAHPELQLETPLPRPGSLLSLWLSTSIAFVRVARE